jgi:hypothetical protein
VHQGCIYHHFWGTLLRAQFADREYSNDFATWCHRSLHDTAVAERLAVIDPADYSDLEELRQALADRSAELPICEDLSVLGEPIRFGRLIVPNRLVVQPMEGCDGTADGAPTDLTIRQSVAVGIVSPRIALVLFAVSKPIAVMIKRRDMPPTYIITDVAWKNIKVNSGEMRGKVP